MWLKVTGSLLFNVLKILPRRDRMKLVQATFVQIALGILDLLGVFLIGGIAAIAFRGVKSESPGERTSKLLNLTGLDSFTMNQQLIFLGIFAVMAFCTKTIFSVIFLRRTLFFLSRKSAETSSRLISKLLTQPSLFRNSKSIQEYIYAVTTGVANLTTGIYGSLIQIVADVGLLLILTVGLFYVDFYTSLVTFFVFVIAGLVLFQATQARAKRLASQNADLIVRSNQILAEAFSSIREIFVRNANYFYSAKIRRQREKLAEFDAELKFLPNVSKYVSEMLLVVGILAITLAQYIKSDTNRAIAVISIFMAASARIAPAIMRIQQNAIIVKTYMASSSAALSLLREMAFVSLPERNAEEFSHTHQNLDASIVLDKISFKYDNSERFAVKDLALCIKPGTLAVIAGPSGSGKSTLIDLIIGALKPTSGKIHIGGDKPESILKKWPGCIGIVSQDAFMINGTIRENICMGLNAEAVPDELIWEALQLSNLKEFVSRTPQLLNYQVGENGNRLSSGQKQRLIIARALITRPKILVLDEATSSLDADSENQIITAIDKLREHMTIISVAHRLSIARSADKVFYLEEGKLVESGTFEEVRVANKNFSNQAKLMGL